jgi:branched-chain amino acid transport system substrate-binding protein
MSDQSKTGPKLHKKSRAASSRRRFLQDSAATAVVAGVAPHLLFGKSARAANRAIKIGFIGPRTGALARFGESNDFILAGIRKAIAGGIAINGLTYPVEILEKDSQSDQKHASEIASELIKSRQQPVRKK